VNVEDETISSTSSYHQYANTKVFNLDHEVSVKVKGVKSGFTYYLSRDNNVFDRLGLHLNSILNTAWELIPFSFILDWFVGIGDWLASQTSEKVEPANSYDTRFIEYSISSTLRNENYYVAKTPLTVINSGKSFSRIITDEQHSFALEFNSALNWGQSADLIAIGSKLINSFFRR
jgi:hypothetical protein